MFAAAVDSDANREDGRPIAHTPFNALTVQAIDAGRALWTTLVLTALAANVQLGEIDGRASNNKAIGRILRSCQGRRNTSRRVTTHGVAVNGPGVPFTSLSVDHSPLRRSSSLCSSAAWRRRSRTAVDRRGSLRNRSQFGTGRPPGRPVPAPSAFGVSASGANLAAFSTSLKLGRNSEPAGSEPVADDLEGKPAVRSQVKQHTTDYIASALAAPSHNQRSTTNNRQSPFPRRLDVDLELAIGHHLFQPAIFLLQLTQAFQIGGLECAEVLSPAVDRLGADTMLLGYLRHRPGIGLAQDGHHLLFGESSLFHGSLVTPRAPFSQASAGPKITEHVRGLAKCARGNLLQCRLH
jgi:hypothetical protein